jgi:hypothetical protein
MHGAFPFLAVSLSPDAVRRILVDLRSAIDACEVDDGCYALPLLRAVETTLAEAAKVGH